MGGDKIGVREEGAQLTADLDEIIAVRAKAVKEDDELAGLARLRRHSGTINRRRHVALRFFRSCRASAGEGQEAASASSERVHRKAKNLEGEDERAGQCAVLHHGHRNVDMVRPHHRFIPFK
jgi:hypothetical protein